MPHQPSSLQTFSKIHVHDHFLEKIKDSAVHIRNKLVIWKKVHVGNYLVIWKKVHLRNKFLIRKESTFIAITCVRLRREYKYMVRHHSNVFSTYRYLCHVYTYLKYWLSAFSEKKYKKCLLRTKTIFSGIVALILWLEKNGHFKS